MPYITQERRVALRQHYGYDGVATAGELNYLFTDHILTYLRNKDMSYQTFNDILGALEGAKMEFVRRIVNPYEDKKILENGDCY